MSGIATINGPEDTITQMARRAFTEFRRREMSVGARMVDWDNAPLLVHVTWKEIIRKALGDHGTLVNCNAALRNPATVIITGLSIDQAEGIRAGIQAKLGGDAMKFSDKAWEEPSQ